MRPGCFARSETSQYLAKQTKTTSKPTHNLPVNQERLHAENLERSTARRTREEAEARDKAAKAAEVADLAKQEAVSCLHRLQKQHEEQVIHTDGLLEFGFRGFLAHLWP